MNFFKKVIYIVAAFLLLFSIINPFALLSSERSSISIDQASAADSRVQASGYQAGSTASLYLVNRDGSKTEIANNIVITRGGLFIYNVPYSNGETFIIRGIDINNRNFEQPVKIRDLVPPNAPTDLAVSLDGLVLTGKAQTGSTVIVKDASGSVIGTVAIPVAVAEYDFFSVTLNRPYISGETLSVTATDDGGVSIPATTNAPSEIVIRYVDENDVALEPSETIRGHFGAAHTATAKAITGYNLTSNPTQVETFTVPKRTITFEYAKIPAQLGTVAIEYVDENGLELALPETEQGPIGTTYTATAKTITGYDLQSAATQTATFSTTTETLTFVYKKTPVQTGTLLIKYVTTAGIELAPSETESGAIGTTYTATAKTFAGYSLTSQSVQSQAFAATQGTITFVYSENTVGPQIGTINVVYVDENNYPLKTTVIKNGPIGEGFTLLEEQFTGYTLTSKPISLSGTYTSQLQTFTFKYEKVVSKVIVEYKVLAPANEDQAVASIASMEFSELFNAINRTAALSETLRVVELTGKYGETFTTEPLQFEGYRLVQLPTNATGTFKEFDQTVLYLYEKIEDDIKVPDEGTKDDETDNPNTDTDDSDTGSSDTDNGTSDGTTNTPKQDVKDLAVTGNVANNQTEKYNQSLPQTDAKSTNGYTVAGIVLLVAGASLVALRRRKQSH